MKFDKGYTGGAAVLLVLTLLAEKDRYGYEIIRTLAARSDETFQWQEGTLYPVLHRLENDGFVTSYRAVSEAGKERKYYRITQTGQAQLTAEQSQWRAFSGAMEQVLRGTGAGSMAGAF